MNVLFRLAATSILLFAMSGCCCVGGCQPSAPNLPNIETSPDGGVTIDVPGEDGGTLNLQPDGSTGKLPEDFPPQLAYPDAKVAATFSQTTGGAKNVFASLTTEDSIDQVAEFYRHKFEEEGWTIESDTIAEANGSKGGGIVAEKDGRKCNAIFSAQGGETGIAITFIDEKQANE